MLGQPIAAEVSIADEPKRTWLWLGPVSGGVELRRVQQSKGIDPEASPDPEHDPQVVGREWFPDLDAAVDELTRRGIDTGAFDVIWKTSNPF